MLIVVFDFIYRYLWYYQYNGDVSPEMLKASFAGRANACIASELNLHKDAVKA
jgi:hypothetical protein